MDDVVYINGTEKKVSYGETTLMARAVFANGETAEIEIKSVDGSDAVTKGRRRGDRHRRSTMVCGAFEMDGDKYELKTISVGDDANFRHHHQQQNCR